MGRKIACLLGCPDETNAARLCIAYEPGSDDALAHCDVRSMRDALKTVGYEDDAIHVVPRVAKADHEVYAAIKQVALGCGNDDDFLFYYSGHGCWSKGGAFSLALLGAEILRSTWLLPLLTEECRAQTKLIILDCCFAGDIEPHTDWDEQRHDLGLLVAGTRHQKAMHDPVHAGSWFTDRLTRALTDPNLWRPHPHPALAQSDGKIGACRLTQWLREEMQRLGEKIDCPGKRIPVPLALPRDIDFTVATVASVKHQLGYPPHLRAALDLALPQADLDAEAAGNAWASCVARQSGTSLDPAPADGSLRALFDALLQPSLFYLNGDALRFPLVSFTAQLLVEQGGDHPLRLWLDEVVYWLRSGGSYDREEIAAAERIEPLPAHSSAPPAQPPCLLIEVSKPDSRERYQVGWDLLDAQGSPTDGDVPSAPLARTALLGSIGKIILAKVGSDTRGVRVEICLPAELLTDNEFIDRIERLPIWADISSDPNAPLAGGHLAHERALALRCWERWGGDPVDKVRHGAPYYASHYQARQSCLDQPPESPCLVWPRRSKTADVAQCTRQLLSGSDTAQRPLAIALTEVPTPDLFGELLCAGVPILLWPRHRAAGRTRLQRFRDDLPMRCDGKGLAALPDALLDHRRDCAASPGPDYQPALLWDTPSHLKYAQDPYDQDYMLEPRP